MQDAPCSPELFAKANGIELCYQTFGAEDGEPLILIMGLGAQMVLWDEAFCLELARRGFRVIRFDNRDIGRSTRFSGGKRVTALQLLGAVWFGRTVPSVYRLSDMANDTAGLLDALGVDRAHVVGASMGGMIAQELALSHPERVLSLTSIMSSSGGRGLPGATRRARAVLMRKPPSTKEEYIANYRRTWKVLRNGSFPEDEARDATRAERNWSRGLNPAGVARQFSAILASGSRRERLKSLRAPTLVIHGARDPLVPLAHGLDVHKHVPGSTLLQVADMGHAISSRHWKTIIEAIAGHARAAIGAVAMAAE